MYGERTQGNPKVVTSSRLKHPDPKLEAVIKGAEKRAWTRKRGKGGGYIRLLCPCGLHQRSVHLTPSDPKYPLNLVKWLERQPCWKDGGE